jgi:hypothetical protein
MMATSTPLAFGRDAQGLNAFAPYPSTNIYQATLTADDEAHVTVPSTSPIWIVSFRYYPNDVWVDVSGATAIVPVGNTLASSTSELNPASLLLTAGTIISMITSQTTADVSVVMWPTTP